MRRQTKLVVLLATALVASAKALDNGLVLTPPMGWNSWNTFAGNIDETKIKGVIDYMVSSGMKDVGYTYVNIDDNWFPNPARNAAGDLIADPVRFQSGMKSLADYAHSKGMKLGIYNDRGTQTCMNIPKSGGQGNEERDAKTYASWGIDYLKYDNCYSNASQKQSDYTKMSKALMSTGRPIVFSICAWSTEPWMAEQGNLWRSTEDIADAWSGTSNLGWSIMGTWDRQQATDTYIYTRPGAWADPDMLEVGHGKLNDIESRSHMALWALAAAPLIAGNDVRSQSAATKAILMDKEVIAIDQDSSGVQCRKVSDNGDLEVYAKPLGKDFTTFAVGLLNRSGSAQNMTINWKDLRLDPNSVSVRNVWDKKDLGNVKTSYSASVPSHGTLLLKVSGKIDTTVTWWLSDIPFVQLTNGSGATMVNKSQGGKTLTLGGKTYTKGIGVNAVSRTAMPLWRTFARLQADLGIDAEVASGSAVFQIFGTKGSKLYESPVCKAGAAPLSIDVSVADQDSIYLVTTDAGDGNTNDHADWAGAKLILSSSSTSARGRQASTGAWNATLQEGQLSIDRQTDLPTTVQLLDVRGRMVMQATIEGTRAHVRLGSLARGIYSVRLSDPTTAASRILVNN